ncbi:hypothetical protein B0H11DRAFT_2418179 [Mycena galericulata]|nr:hypothetical protein B0H11DRAFT_2418179 [Mycena galericulata]
MLSLSPSPSSRRSMPSGFLLLLILTVFLSLVTSICKDAQARLPSRPSRSVTLRRDAPAFSSASWIWVADSNGTASTSAGNAAFLRTFTTPAGQSASSAVISMTAVGNFFLWVNGQPIGASGAAQDGWKSAQVLRAELNASVNVFSVLAVNGLSSAAPPPGLLAAIQVLYTDSTTSTVVSDASWVASRNIPQDFPTPVDPFQFTPAAVAASYGSGPWGQSAVVPAATLNPLNLSASTWIWSTNASSVSAPVGFVGFRRTIATPAGKRAQSATVILTIDNSFVLYLNGAYIGAPPASATGGNWAYAQQFSVALDPSVNSNVFTVVGQNLPATGTATLTSAGFIGAIQVFYADGSSNIVPTDSLWLSSPNNYLTLPIFLNTSDSLLVPAIAQGSLGMAPWGQLSISDALDARAVPSAPYSNATASASPTPSPGSSHAPGVPVGAIVGAVVGAVVVVLGIALIAFLLLRRRRGRRLRSAAVTEAPPLAFAFDTLVPVSEYASTVPTAFPTPATRRSFDSDVAGPSGSDVHLSLPPPAPPAPRRKFDRAAAVTRRTSGAANAYAAPPPSYTDSESGSLLAVDGGSQEQPN